MSNDRRPGIGFGDGSRVDGGHHGYDDDLDDQPEATRAMDIVDDIDQETSMPSVPPHRPPARARPQPARPAPPPAAAYSAPATLHDPLDFQSDNEDATRMIDSESFAPAPAAPAQHAPRTPIELRVVSGPDRGEVHAIESGEYMVGRGLDCQIVLKDPAVSRKHFRVVRNGDHAEVIDMGGANGTNINGQRASRHQLAAGDHIEVGTTVMECAIAGVTSNRGRDFPASAVSLPRGGPTAAPKSNTGLIIGLVAAGVFVLGGGAVAAWLVMDSSDDVVVDEANDPEANDIIKLIEHAKVSMEDRDWSSAVDQLKEAHKISADDAEVKGLLAKANGEVEAEETIADGKDLAKKGEFEAAMKRFKDVPQTSEQYADAREELNGAREEFFRAQIRQAKKSWETRDKTAAIASLDAVLAIDDKNAEARLIKEKIESGADLEMNADGDATAVGEQPDKDDKDDKGGKPSGDARADDRASSNNKAQMAAGLRAYHNREWSAAEAAFTQVAKGGSSRKDAAKAGEYAAAVKEVGESVNGAGSASNPAKAARLWHKAYKADRRIDNHHGPYLVKMLTVAYVSAAKEYYDARRYAEAAEAAREAMNFDPDNAQAMALDDKCRDAAQRMLKEAEAQLAQGSYASARDKARQVMKILGMMDPSAQKAGEIAKKAQEASTGGDED